MKLIPKLLLCLFALVSSSFADSGKAIYEKNCVGCHGNGVAGAPKTGDKLAWKDRAAGGLDYLVKSAIEGKQGYGGSMPPRGGNEKLSDHDVKIAVQYMLDQFK